MKRLILLTLVFMQGGCAHFGLDSEADIFAENCYAYRYGDKLRRINVIQALDWCQRSASLGNSNSQTLLAELYYMGLGGEYDVAKAEQWFLKSAKQGHAHGQFMLYKIYSVNKTQKFQNKARYWLRQAKASQYPLAMGVE